MEDVQEALEGEVIAWAGLLERFEDGLTGTLAEDDAHAVYQWLNENTLEFVPLARWNGRKFVVSGFEILLAYGGPNVWAVGSTYRDPASLVLRGAWGSARATEHRWLPCVTAVLCELAEGYEGVVIN